MNSKQHSMLAAAMLAALIAGCSGGGATMPSAPSAPNQPKTPQHANAVFSILVPSAAASAVRPPHYISPNTQSVSIVETDTGATPSPATIANVTSGSPNCSTVSGGLSCSITVAANVGTDAFTVKTFDQPGGAGNVLSSGSITATIVAGQANTTVPVVLGGVVKTLGVTLADPYAPVGGSGTTLTVTAKDPSGATIVGTYDNPVTLSASGVTLGKSSISSSTDAQNVSVTYNGVQTSAITINAAGDGAAASTTLTPGSGVVYYKLGTDPQRDIAVAALTQGPDGDIYYSTDGGFQCVSTTGYCSETVGNIGRLDPATGTSTEIQLQHAPFELGFTPDGALWAGEFGSFGAGAGSIARITPFSQAGVDEIALPTPTPAPTPTATPLYTWNSAHMIVGSDGNVWFTDEIGRHLGKVVASGTPTTASISMTYLSSTRPRDVAMTSDGSLWVASLIGGAVTHYSQSGTLLNTYTTPEQASQPTPDPHGFPPGSSLYSIVNGSDGNLYVTDLGNYAGYPEQSYMYKMTPSGGFTSIPLLSQYSSPLLAAAGTGQIAFTDGMYNAIVTQNMSTGSLRAAIAKPAESNGFSYSPSFLAFAKDGSVWFGCTGYYAAYLGPACVAHVVLTSVWSVSPSSVTLNGTGTMAAQAIGIIESGDTGPFTVTSSDTSIASVQSIANYDHNFLIVGNAPGTCTLTVKDKNGRTVSVPVSVTATNGTVQVRHASVEAHQR